jgi:hypothetical protein
LQTGRSELQQPLGAGESLEVVLAQVPQREPGHLRVLDHFRGRVREQNLTAAGGIADASRAMYTEPNVAVGVDIGLGGV